MQQKAALVILDGWGIGKHDKADAVWNANTPYTDSLSSNFAFTTLRTDGENVGLPKGQMGNSEVGHMNIGAGRIVWQMLVRINKAFETLEIESNTMWLAALEQAKESNVIHLMGLVSDGGVHSHINHLIGLVKSAAKAGIKHIFIHAFLDGRDTDPKGGLGYIKHLETEIAETGAKISTMVGRYYAMDRDKRWERVKRAWDLMVNGNGQYFESPESAIQFHYNENLTDEFMEPIRVLNNDEGLIKNGEVVISFNYRTDRGREITEVLTQKDLADFSMYRLNIHYYTMTAYDETFNIDGVLFENQNLQMTLGEVLSMNNKTQLRAAETEKYPHVSFFFSGGRENEFEGESRLLVNSPKVATYDLQPAMSAPELCNKALEFISQNQPDFVCLNFANPDMVGHTGVYSAIIAAVETVDECLQKLAKTLLDLNYHTLVIADHGNADFAINSDGSPNTAHTTNPVPCWLLSNNLKPHMHKGILADVAPTLLKMMEIHQPVEMTGRPLYE